MKQVLKNKSIMSIALFAILLSASTSALANNDSSRVIPVELKFIGEVKNQLVFLLNFEGNADENEFIVSIIDETGNTLYKEAVKGEKISKRFLLNTDEVGDNTIKFLVTSKKTNQTVTYQVNHVSRTIQDVVVNKLK